MLSTVLLAQNAAGFAPQLTPAHSASRMAGVAMQAKSKAIPFLAQPPALDGTLPGDVGFDPLMLSSLIPLKWAREAELKHCRLAMLATAGWLAVDFGITAPEAPQVSSLAAHDATVDKGPMWFLLLVASGFEIVAGTPKVFQLLNDPDAAGPGEFKFNPLNIKSDKVMEEKEIANGRLAMMAFSGIVTQAALTGNGFPYMY